MALGKFAVSRSATDASEVVRTQADVEQGRLVSSIATVQYLAWAIPAIGFLGTVRGLAGGMSMAAGGEESTQQFLDQATRHLTIAFDCTFVALALSLVVMYFLHTIQRAEEGSSWTARSSARSTSSCESMTRPPKWRPLTRSDQWVGRTGRGRRRGNRTPGRSSGWT